MRWWWNESPNSAVDGQLQWGERRQRAVKYCKASDHGSFAGDRPVGQLAGQRTSRQEGRTVCHCLQCPLPSGDYANAVMHELVHRNLRRLDKQFVWHPFTPMKLWAESDPLVITCGPGDAPDRQRRQPLPRRRQQSLVQRPWPPRAGDRRRRPRQLDKVAHTTMLGLASEPAILLAERLMQTRAARAGEGLLQRQRGHRDRGGIQAGRPILVQRRQASERNEFVGFAEAYHGDTVGAMSIGRMPAFHKPYFPMLFKAHFAPSPYVYRSETPHDPEAVKQNCLAALERILEQHGPRIAGVCIEPMVQGAGGMIVQPAGFLSGVAALARQYGTLLIADEVAVGFGRTGRMFACEHEGVRPDLMCVAKGITGGYLPLAATFATQEIFDAFLGEPWEGRTFYHGHTYTGNPLACAAALASLDLFEKNNLVVARRAGTARSWPRCSTPCARCRTSATSANSATWWGSNWSRTKPAAGRSTPGGGSARRCVSGSAGTA